jgi:hypothetical protein
MPEPENALEDTLHGQFQGRAFWFVVRGDYAKFERVKKRLEEMQCGIKFAHAQVERDPRNGLHLQGMIIFFSPRRPTTLNGLFEAWGNLPTRGDVERMSEYVHKEYTREEEDYIDIGMYERNAKTMITKRPSHWPSFRDYCNRHKLDLPTAEEYWLSQGASFEDCAWYRKQWNKEKAVERYQQLRDYAESVAWKPWQEDLKNKLDATPDPRKIYVILDKKGNSGKSFFMKYYKLLNPDRVVSLSNGKTADLMHVIVKKPNVEVIMFNLPRSVHGIVNYQAMEQAKDGDFTSTKYDGEEFTTNNTSLVIFTNEPLNWEAMSKDRWMIMTIDGISAKWEDYETYKHNGGEDGIASIRTNNNADPETVEPGGRKRQAEMCPDECYCPKCLPKRWKN